MDNVLSPPSPRVHCDYSGARANLIASARAFFVSRSSYAHRMRGVATDPSHIEIHVKNPSGVMVTASALKSAVGVYYNNVTASIPGEWVFQFSASGSVVAVGNGNFSVRRGVL